MINSNLKRDGIPTNFYGASAKDIKNVNPENFKKLCDWAVKPKGFIIFHGPSGRGKTYSAIACMYFFEKVKFINWNDQKFLNVSDLYQIWLANFNNELSPNFTLLQTLKGCKVLILDDLGAKNPSDGFLDYLYTVINHRCDNSELITIFTTNCTSKQLTDAFGQRIISRILSGVNVKFEGKDLREIEF